MSNTPSISATKIIIIRLSLAGIVMLGLAGCTQYTKTTVTLSYYKIGGNSLKQIDREIYKKGPRINGIEHAVAISNIKMTPDITLLAKPGGCIVSRARIKVRAKVTLPQWLKPQGAKHKIVRAWSNLDRYTRLHEAVHVAIADKYARQLEQELKSLKTGRNCFATRKITRSLIDSTMKKHDREQRKFDHSEKARFAKLAKRGKPS